MAEKPSSEAPKPEKTDTESSYPPDRASSRVSSATETLPSVGTPSQPAGDDRHAAGDRRSFSQLLAGAMSPVGGSRATPILAVPVETVRVPVVAVPCFIAPASLLESSGFTGQFTMTHQAVLATVTAQAQLQLQVAYPSSSSDSLKNSFPQPMISTPSRLPLQQRQAPLSEENVCTPEAEQAPLSDQKPQSAHIVVKTTSSDGYNWRKYGQKQVKSSESSRSYYKCTHVNCSVKKKVERCQDGGVIEIIYKGQHNHDPPQKTRCSKERGFQSGGPFIESETLDLPRGELNESDPSTSKIEQCFGNETPEQRLHCSSDCEGDAAIKAEEDLGDEPNPKRRFSENPSPHSAPVLKLVRDPKIIVQTACDVGLVSDGYRWRKYGQKIVKGNPNPRSYYRCTQIGCPVRKHVERASEDAKSIVITYEGKHNHDLPPPKNISDPTATALLIAATAAVTSDGQVQPNKKSSTEWPPDIDGKITGEKALELGGEKALESAHTLLSIGFNSTPGEDHAGNSSESIQRPLFIKNPAAVPVQNS